MSLYGNGISLHTIIESGKALRIQRRHRIDKDDPWTKQFTLFHTHPLSDAGTSD